ncbi:amino acid adenylation domain-containing protein [Micromonospora echinofusca]
MTEPSNARRELMRRLLAGDSTGEQPIRRRPAGTQPLPLSFGQQRLWILDQLDADAAAYNASVVFQVAGDLDADLLDRAVRTVVARHEILRTVFHRQDGQPVQVVRPDMPVPIRHDDLRAVAEPGRSEAARKLAADEAAVPFDLERGPLLRLRLIRLDAADWRLCLTMHHIVCDGWSLDVLVDELSAAFSALAAGDTPRLPELPVQYADYAIWQREQLRGPGLDRLLAHWRGRLAGAPTVLQLPTDRPRPAVQSFRGATVPLVLPPDVVRQIQAVCKQRQVTPFMLLLAGFKALLARYSGSADVVVGTPVGHRRHTALEPLVGFFVNTLVLRTAVAGGSSFADLLDGVRATALDAFEHQDLPFERLVEELSPERDLSVNPLIQVLFVLQNAPAGARRLGAASLTATDPDTTTAKFDLTLSLESLGDEIVGRIEYSTDLFDRSSAQRIADSYVTLVAAAVAEPDRPVDRLPLLTADQEHRLLRGHNDTAAEFPADTCLAQLVEAQVARTPELTAVSCGAGSLTYRQLNARANQLARLLLRHGAGPDRLVGIFLDKSLHAAVAILATLKAGAGYVPLDPTYPAERVGHMLTDSAATVVVTRSALLPALAEIATEVRTLDMDTLDDALDALPDGDLPPAARPDDLAYVIYTSGSTGRPKGVMMQHRALVNLLAWYGRVLRPRARILQFSSLSFDASFADLFFTWYSGGQVVMVGDRDDLSPAGVLRALAEEGIERAVLPAAMFHPLAEEYARRRPALPRLRELVSNAEQLELTPMVREMFAALPGCVLHNHYGPSETHVATGHTMLPGEAWPSHVPIGRPISNSTLYIVDRHLRPVPQGVVGEVYLGGTAVGRGYLHRPDLTAQRYLPDPYATQPGGRWYRTGDLARYLPDGVVEFLGRADQQAKIRGFRVELGEVEAALVEAPGVRQAVAAVHEFAPGDRRLVAYLTGVSEDGPSVGEVRRSVRQILPEYMVPSSYVVLPEFPLTPSGKVDRQSLPAPERSRPDLGSVPVAPRTATERLLAGCWAEVLDLDAPQIGVHDGFFDLGGHSLLATRLISMINDAYGTELGLKRVFQHPTPAGFAALLADQLGEDVADLVSATVLEVASMSAEGVERGLTAATGGEVEGEKLP